MLKGHSNAVDSCEFCSGDETVLVSTSSGDETARLWDLRIQRAVRCLSNAREINHAAVSGDKLTFGTNDGRIGCFDLRTGSVVTVLSETTRLWSTRVSGEVVNKVVMGPSSSVYACDDDGSVFRLNVNNGKMVMSKRLHASLCTGISLRGGEVGKEVVSVGTDCCLKQWMGSDARILKSVTARVDEESQNDGVKMCNPPHLLSVDCDPKGRVAAAAMGDGRVLLWDLEKKKMAGFLRGHNYSVSCVAWAQSNVLASVGNDKQALIWRVDPRKPKEATGQPPQAVIPLPAKPNWACARNELLALACGNEILIHQLR